MQWITLLIFVSVCGCGSNSARERSSIEWTLDTKKEVRHGDTISCKSRSPQSSEVIFTVTHQGSTLAYRTGKDEVKILIPSTFPRYRYNAKCSVRNGSQVLEEKRRTFTVNHGPADIEWDLSGKTMILLGETIRCSSAAYPVSNITFIASCNGKTVIKIEGRKSISVRFPENESLIGICSMECSAVNGLDPKQEINTNINVTSPPTLEKHGGKVCVMKKLREDFVRMKPSMNLRFHGGFYLTRTILRRLTNCTILVGDFLIARESFYNRDVNEDVREEDLKNVVNVKKIFGRVKFFLRDADWIKSLWFLRDLRSIENRGRNGFVAMDTYLEALNLTRVHLNISDGEIKYNADLCYINSHTFPNVRLKENKSPKECVKDKKLCSENCDRKRGCSGPGNNHCVKCKDWRAGDECVTKCEVAPGFYTQSLKGTVCSHCHPECSGTCTGPEDHQCEDCKHVKSGGRCLRQCPHTKYAEHGQCIACAEECMGYDLQNTEYLRSPACNGAGLGNCSVPCRENEFLVILTNGIIGCHRCSTQCKSGCRDPTDAGCFECRGWKQINDDGTWRCTDKCDGDKVYEDGQRICRMETRLLAEFVASIVLNFLLIIIIIVLYSGLRAKLMSACENICWTVRKEQGLHESSSITRASNGQSQINHLLSGERQKDGPGLHESSSSNEPLNDTSQHTYAFRHEECPGPQIIA